MSKSENTAVVASRWAAYSAAASAAAAGGALTSEAEAAITVVDVNVFLEDRTQGDGYFDVFGAYGFGGAGASFVFQQAFNEIGTSVGVLTVIGGGNIDFAGGVAGAYAYPSNLAYGAALSAQSFGVPAGSRGDMAWGAGYTNSQFLNAGTSYLGFRFDLGGGTQYGWAELDMEGAIGNRATFVRYAWADVGESITVGQIPAPGAVAALALGAAGVGGFRRSRRAS
jgi:hypothetical protein